MKPQELLEQLSKSGVLTIDDVKSLKKDHFHNEVETLIVDLVEKKKLTPYQASVVTHGAADDLVFGEYVVIERIGQGGMGQVFKALHRRMDRIVALKTISKTLTSPNALQRFMQEVKTVAKLSHPNIVPAFDAGEQGGVHYLVMEFIDGTDLAALVRKNGPLPLEHALNYVLQAAKGLHHAHKVGVIHRDIKPHNLLVDKKGVVRVLDLGLAYTSYNQNRITQTGAILGTVDYMSPEQAADPKLADQRSDVYSLGCTLFFLLTGKVVYPAPTLVEKILAHEKNPIPSIRDQRPDVPELLDKTFQKMVVKKPADRYQSMNEVGQALFGCIPRGEQPTARKKRHWVGACVVLGVIAIVGAVGAYAYRQRGTDVQPSLSGSPVVTTKTESRTSLGGWAPLFNGHDLTGWKVYPGGTGKWKVEDGAMVGNGDFNILFTERGDFRNFRLKVEAKISSRGISGILFRSKYVGGFPPAYEAVIDSNSSQITDARTGSLWKLVSFTESIVPPATWFTYEIIADDNHIVLKVNDRITVETKDRAYRHSVGHIALEQHHEGSVVHFRKIEILELPSDSTGKSKQD